MYVDVRVCVCMCVVPMVCSVYVVCVCVFRGIVYMSVYTVFLLYDTHAGGCSDFSNMIVPAFTVKIAYTTYLIEFP